MQGLCIQITEDGAGAERLAVLSGYLRTELLQLDVEGVTSVHTGEPPPGSRGLGIAAVGALFVAVGQAADGIRSVVLAIKDWLLRGDDTGRMVRLELNGDTLELSRASTADQERLIDLFISRHATGEVPGERPPKSLGHRQR